MRRRYRKTDDPVFEKSFTEAVKNNQSLNGVARALGLKENSGGVNRHLKKVIKRLGLDVSHFTGSGHLKGRTHDWSSLPLKELLVKGSDCDNRVIKKRLLKEGLLEEKCKICHITDWLGKPLVLQLDHENGDHTDNRIKNLRFLCPNCHTQTETWGNRKSAYGGKADTHV